MPLQVQEAKLLRQLPFLALFHIQTVQITYPSRSQRPRATFKLLMNNLKAKVHDRRRTRKASYTTSCNVTFVNFAGNESRFLDRPLSPCAACTITAKDEPMCRCWNIHEAAAAEESGEAIRRYALSGHNLGIEQWGNPPLHVRSLPLRLMRTHVFYRSVDVFRVHTYRYGWLSSYTSIYPEGYKAHNGATSVEQETFCWALCHTPITSRWRLIMGGWPPWRPCFVMEQMWNNEIVSTRLLYTSLVCEAIRALYACS